MHVCKSFTNTQTQMSDLLGMCAFNNLLVGNQEHMNALTSGRVVGDMKTDRGSHRFCIKHTLLWDPLRWVSWLVLAGNMEEGCAHRLSTVLFARISAAGSNTDFAESVQQLLLDGGISAKRVTYAFHEGFDVTTWVCYVVIHDFFYCVFLPSEACHQLHEYSIVYVILRGQMAREWTRIQALFWATRVVCLDMSDALKAVDWIMDSPWKLTVSAVRRLGLALRGETVLLFAVTTEYWDEPFESTVDE
jgi:hypothetical protein